MTNLTAFIGDSVTLAVPLTWQDAPFAPGDDWALIFTAKHRARDTDAEAVIQKASGAGIEVTGYTASVSLVPLDTLALRACDLVFDIQAQHVTTGAVRTAAIGILALARDITRETETSIPVNTTEDPLPFGPTMPEGLGDFDSITIAAGDELELVKDGVTYWIPLYRRA